MDPNPPDVILLGAEWRERALLRAQLIEEGLKVVAIDEWPMPRVYRRAGMKPRVLLIDLHGLPTPRETLDDARFVMPPKRVLVVTALGTLTGEDIRRFGFTAVERPVTIGQIVAATTFLLANTSSKSQEHGVPPTHPR
jgi:hypothetical protein